jgi:phage gp36-like protein
MAYSDLTTLQQRMPEQVIIDLTDDQHTGLVNEDPVDRAIADADTEIDSYLAGRYPVPVDPASALLQRLSLDLSVEILYGRRPDLDMPEAVKTAAKNARALLARIAAKDAHLPGVAEADTSGTSSSGAMFIGNERLFTRDSLKGM